MHIYQQYRVKQTVLLGDQYLVKCVCVCVGQDVLAFCYEPREIEIQIILLKHVPWYVYHLLSCIIYSLRSSK